MRLPRRIRRWDIQKTPFGQREEPLFILLLVAPVFYILLPLGR